MILKRILHRLLRSSQVSLFPVYYFNTDANSTLNEGPIGHAPHTAGSVNDYAPTLLTGATSSQTGRPLQMEPAAAVNGKRKNSFLDVEDSKKPRITTDDRPRLPDTTTLEPNPSENRISAGADLPAFRLLPKITSLAVSSTVKVGLPPDIVTAAPQLNAPNFTSMDVAASNPIIKADSLSAESELSLTADSDDRKTAEANFKYTEWTYQRASADMVTASTAFDRSLEYLRESKQRMMEAQRKVSDIEDMDFRLLNWP